MPYIYGQLLRAAVETLGSDPSTNADKFTGRLWYNTATNLLKYADASNAVKQLLTSGDVVNADINASAGIVYSKLSIATNDIALNKLAALTASRAVVSDGSGVLAAATTTATEIGYVNGVTSAIQTQLDAKQARSTLTTKGDIYVATASATVARLGAGTNGFVLTADSAQTEGIKWASPGTKVIQSVTTTDTVGATTDVVFASTAGGAYTLTLAAGSTGKVVRIIKTTNDFNLLTIDGASAEQINEYGTSTDTTRLDTVGESVELTWNGTVWVVTDRKIPSITTAYTPTTQGFGTVSNMNAYWVRIGNQLQVSATWTNGTVSADEARVNFPSGCPASLSTISTRIVGPMANGNTGTSNNFNTLASPSEAFFKMNRQNGVSGLASSNGNAFNNSEAMSIIGIVPIEGWKG